MNLQVAIVTLTAGVSFLLRANQYKFRGSSVGEMRAWLAPGVYRPVKRAFIEIFG